MLWFYQRGDEVITVETRVDRTTGEYLLITQTADHDQKTERFKDVAEFQMRLVEAERQLAADRWTQAGPPVFLLDGWPKNSGR